MNKLVIIGLTFIYLLSGSLGTTLHECKGMATVYSKSTNKCCCNKKMKGCCSNKKEVKKADQQTSSEKFSIQKVLVPEYCFISDQSQNNLSLFTTDQKIIVPVKSPPKIPIFIRWRILLI